MFKKKVLTAIAFASLLVVGGGVGATALISGSQVLAADNAELVRTPLQLLKGETKIVTPGNKTINYEYLDDMFVMKDDVQKISSITVSTSSAASGEYFIQVGYKGSDELHPYYYTDKVSIPDISNPITFDNGKEPCIVKIYGANLSGVTLGYKCENLNNKNYNDYPMVEAGWYVIGKGSFLNPLRPKEFSPISGLKMDDANGTLTLSHEFKAKDEICFYNPSVTNQNGYYGINSSDTYDEYYTRNQNNIVFNKDVNVKLTLKDGYLNIDRVGNLDYKFTLLDTSNSGTKFENIYLKSTINDWGATRMPFTYENGTYVLNVTNVNPNELFKGKLNLSEADWSGKQVYSETGEGGNFEINLPWESSNIQISFDFSQLVGENVAGKVNIMPL